MTFFKLFQTINIPYETKTRDSNEYKEYKGDEVNDKIFREILKQSYRMFRLFYGTFQLNAVGTDLNEQLLYIRKKLDHFYSRVSILYIIYN